MQDNVYVAKIGKAVGLQGQLKLHIDSDFPEQFVKNSTFITNKNTTLIIESFNKKSGVVKFVGFDRVDDAKKLINQQLFSTLEDTKNNCKLDENQYFWFDLINCEIKENDQILGTIVDIQRYPQCDYFEIATSKFLVDEKALSKKFLLPYLPQYIKSVDIENKIVLAQGAMQILEAS
jgi:16S rRNA processing protein RimM